MQVLRNYKITGLTMLSGLLSLLFIFLLREKYVATSNLTARNEARQLFGFSRIAAVMKRSCYLGMKVDTWGIIIFSIL